MGYIYRYIERERERQTERDRHTHTGRIYPTKKIRLQAKENTPRQRPPPTNLKKRTRGASTGTKTKWGAMRERHTERDSRQTDRQTETDRQTDRERELG